MDGYNLPYFKGAPRQRGRGFGALAKTVARTTLPILKKHVLTAAKKIGRCSSENTCCEKLVAFYQDRLQLKKQ